MTQQNTINIGDKEYDVNSLPDTVKTLISVYAGWQKDLETARAEFDKTKLEIAKVEAAMRDLTREIIQTVEASDATPVQAAALVAPGSE